MASLRQPLEPLPAPLRRGEGSEKPNTYPPSLAGTVGFLSDRSKSCHPERSEGSRDVRGGANVHEILRFAQNDIDCFYADCFCAPKRTLGCLSTLSRREGRRGWSQCERRHKSGATDGLVIGYHPDWPRLRIPFRRADRRAVADAGHPRAALQGVQSRP
jgi:hypothetical protein